MTSGIRPPTTERLDEPGRFPARRAGLVLVLVDARRQLGLGRDEEVSASAIVADRASSADQNADVTPDRSLRNREHRGQRAGRNRLATAPVGLEDLLQPSKVLLRWRPPGRPVTHRDLHPPVHVAVAVARGLRLRLRRPGPSFSGSLPALPST